MTTQHKILSWIPGFKELPFPFTKYGMILVPDGKRVGAITFNLETGDAIKSGPKQITPKKKKGKTSESDIFPWLQDEEAGRKVTYTKRHYVNLYTDFRKPNGEFKRESIQLAAVALLAYRGHPKIKSYHCSHITDDPVNDPPDPLNCDPYKLDWEPPKVNAERQMQANGYNRGAKNPNANKAVTDEIRDAIYEAFKSGYRTKAALALEYEMHRSSIGRIIAAKEEEAQALLAQAGG